MFKNNYHYPEGFEDLAWFFRTYKHLFKPTINGEADTNKHLNNYRILKDKFKIEFPYGKCFPISQFIFYYLGGYDSEYELRCIRKIPITIEDYSFTTSHWFVIKKGTNHIIDLSKEQFDKILNVEDLYSKSRRANYGYPYFHNRKHIKYDNTVPCKQVLTLYKKYREVVEVSPLLEFFHERHGYEL